MTDKEQIIIDGVNITGCTWCDFEPDAEPYCHINDGEDLTCEDNPNCYFKQLARKTKEYVKLKKNNQILCDLYKNVDSCLQKRTEKFDHYRKALDEIEKTCLKVCSICWIKNKCNKEYSNCKGAIILNIINKAKEISRSEHRRIEGIKAVHSKEI